MKGNPHHRHYGTKSFNEVKGQYTPGERANRIIERWRFQVNKSVKGLLDNMKVFLDQCEDPERRCLTALALFYGGMDKEATAQLSPLFDIAETSDITDILNVRNLERMGGLALAISHFDTNVMADLQEQFPGYYKRMVAKAIDYLESRAQLPVTKQSRVRKPDAP